MSKKYKAIVFGTKEVIAEAKNFKECKEKALQNCGLNKFYYDCEGAENGTGTEQ